MKTDIEREETISITAFMPHGLGAKNSGKLQAETAPRKRMKIPYLPPDFLRTFPRSSRVTIENTKKRNEASVCGMSVSTGKRPTMDRKIVVSRRVARPMSLSSPPNALAFLTPRENITPSAPAAIRPLLNMAAEGSVFLPKSLSQLPVHVNQGDMPVAMNIEARETAAAITPHIPASLRETGLFILPPVS